MQRFLRFGYAATSVFFLLASLLFINPSKSHASHAMGEDIWYIHNGGNDYTFFVAFYRDCGGISEPTSFTLSINSSCYTGNLTLNKIGGTGVEVSPLCPTSLPSSECSGGTLPGVEQYIYSGTFTLPCTATDWVFSTNTCDRNPSDNLSGVPCLYVETTLNNAIGNNSAPIFSNLPVPYICDGTAYTYNHGAVDFDGDLLQYTLINALTTGGANVTYNAPYTPTDPLPTMTGVTIDSNTGAVTFTPNGLGTYTFTILVEEYRGGVVIGSTMRDIQVEVISCAGGIAPTLTTANNGAGTFNIPGDHLTLCSLGGTIDFDLTGFDGDLENMTIVSNDVATNIPGATFTVSNNGTTTASANFTWTPGAGDVGTYTFTVQVEDDHCPTKASNVYTYTIDVAAGVDAGPDLVYCMSGGTPVLLNANGGSSFVWTSTPVDASMSCTNCKNPQVSPAVTTTYIVTNNCGARDTVVVTPSNPTVTASAGRITLCSADTTQLNSVITGCAGCTIQWTPTTGLSDPNIANPIANVSSTTDYIVTVFSGSCTVRDTVTVTVTGSASVTATASNYSVCAGTPVNLDANFVDPASCSYSYSTTAYSTESGTPTTLTLGDDVLSGAIALPFQFEFYCNKYNQIYISSNGFVTFDGSGGSDLSNDVIPSTNGNEDVIALMWDDLISPTVDYFTVGTAPNRKFVIDYNATYHYGGSFATEPVVGQIVLHETTNEIDIICINCQGDASGTSATQGIENSDASFAIAVTGRNDADWTASTEKITFVPIPPAGVTYSWTPTGSLDNPNIQTPVATPNTTTTYTVTVDDGSCTYQDTVTITVIASVDAGNDTTICTGSTANLNATYTGIMPSSCTYNLTNPGYSAETGTATTLTLGDDVLSGAIPLPFSFDFFCNTYNQIYISSNGFVTFDGTGGSDLSNDLIPSANGNEDIIALMWDDLVSSTVDYFTVGTAPNRKFVIDYNNSRHFGGSAPAEEVLGQIVLHETTYEIDIICISCQQDASDGSATQGIENFDASIGMAVAGRNNSAWSATNDKWTFTPPPTALVYSWTPTTGLSDPNIQNPTATVAANTTYTVSVDNGTCIVQDTVLVSVGPPANLVWTGVTSTDWHTASNWDQGCLPECGTNVTIPDVSGSSGNFPVISTSDGDCQDITIDANASLTINSGLNLNVCGDFLHNGSTNLGTAGTVAFVGTANQDFTNNSGTNMPNIVINNANTVTLLTNMNLRANCTLTFGANKGVVITGGNRVYVRNNAPGAVSGHTAAGYIYGNLRRNVTGTQSYDLPVGDAPAGLGYQLANITFTVAPTFTYLDAQFVPYGATPVVALAECGADYNCARAGHGKWVIDPDAGTSTYSITIYPVGGTPCGVTSTVMKQPTGAAGAWSLQGTPCGGLTRTGLTTFSEFAEVSSTIPLPVDFISLQAIPKTNFIDVIWETKQEENNSGFEIQRSINKDAGYKVLGFVQGNGTTTQTSNYNFEDYEVQSDVVYYYRLKQIDFDGVEKYTNVVEAMLSSEGFFSIGAPYPNPTSNGSKLDFSIGKEGYVKASLYNMLGQKMKTIQEGDLESGNYSLDIPTEGLASGMYLIKWQYGKEVKTFKLQVKR